MTLSRPKVVELLRANGLRPSRALGQNFVVDPNTVRRIARLAELEGGQPVIEIGAGLGALTLALLETGAVVTAVEVDRGIVPVLRTIVEPAGARVIEADATRLDWDVLTADALAGTDAGAAGDAAPCALVANLPYNVATPVVVTVLEEAPGIDRMLVMVQREVGERLVAGVGDPAYGAVSVKVAYYAEATVVGRVPATVFLPRPKVESALVRLTRRPVAAVDPALVTPERLFGVVRAGFGQRRKTLRRSLAGVVDPAAFEVAGVDPGARAEELDLAAWEESLPLGPSTIHDGGVMEDESGTLTTLQAPAKLTLSLRVTGVRPDGFHEIDAEMVSLDLADELILSSGVGLQILDRVAGGLGVGDLMTNDDNLVLRALRLARRHASVRLEKRIPVGAGLGGGSSDAAAILRWAGMTDPEDAAKLGADVPFCLRGGRARVTGIGEVVEPLPFEDRTFVLLMPPLAIDTNAVYGAWDQLQRRPKGVQAVLGLAGEERNDLEAAAVRISPELLHWRDTLAAVTGVAPTLAGSGSTWFIEGDPHELGVDDRSFLVFRDARAPLVTVRTTPAMSALADAY